jgi:ABC-type multidrug transport system ATPase subunit
VAAGARAARQGVTIILTTHYIEEAEEMADRIGVINKGELILVEDKAELMRKLGKKQLTLHLQQPLERVPAESLAALAGAVADGTRWSTPSTPRPRHRHRRAAARIWPRRHRLQGPADHAELAGGHLRQPGEGARP